MIVDVVLCVGRGCVLYYIDLGLCILIVLHCITMKNIIGVDLHRV